MRRRPHHKKGIGAGAGAARFRSGLARDRVMPEPWVGMRGRGNRDTLREAADQHLSKYGGFPIGPDQDSDVLRIYEFRADEVSTFGGAALDLADIDPSSTVHED